MTHNPPTPGPILATAAPKPASTTTWVGHIGGGWDYRLFTRQVPTGEGDTEPEFFIGEAYYDKNGQVMGWTGPVEALGETPDEVRQELARMYAACECPVLDYDAEPTTRKPDPGASS